LRPAARHPTSIVSDWSAAVTPALPTKQPGTSPGCPRVSAVCDLTMKLYPVWPAKYLDKRIVPSYGLLKLCHPGGDEGARTPDIRLAKAALSQLSYIPKLWPGRARPTVGLSGLEPLTFPLSEGCSNQLS